MRDKKAISKSGLIKAKRKKTCPRHRNHPIRFALLVGTNPRAVQTPEKDEMEKGELVTSPPGQVISVNDWALVEALGII